MRQKLSFAIGIVGLVAAACAVPQTPEPRLIVVVSVDQMRFDYLTRFAPLYSGAFKKILERGAVFSNAYYRHSNSETGPGHSVLLSGRHAANTGIVANTWYDRYLQQEINVVDDPVQAPVGGRGRSASPTNFIGFTLGDKLKEKWPAARVVGISFKDRAAILMAGHRADAAYWFENDCGCFITSTYYMKEPPAWMVRLNARRLPDQYASRPWTRLVDDEALYTKYSREDAFPTEWDLKDTTFPHAHRGRPGNSEYYDNLRRMPYADEILLEATLAAMKAHDLGSDAVTDVLAVGFSASDYIGHTYGPFSQEAMDNYLRLDATLDRLIAAVEDRVGAGHVLFVLSADHGAMPLPEFLQRQGLPAKRVPASTLESAVRSALAMKYPDAPNLVLDFDSPNFVLNVEGIRAHGLARAEVEQTAIDALLATGAVEKVYTQADLLFGTGEGDPHFALFRNSFFQPRSPDLMVLVKQYHYVDNRPGGTGHGTAWDYDRHVPIVFMGPTIRPGQYNAPAGPEDIAPTLGKILGIAYPIEPDSRILSEVIP